MRKNKLKKYKNIGKTAMCSDKKTVQCQTDYYSQYQSMYDQVIAFDQGDFTGVEFGEDMTQTIYSDVIDTSIQQPSHPYNGDITPVA
jgi:hypothetical protein